MKKIATYLILFVALSVLNSDVYAQGYGNGYGQDYGYNDNVYDNPYDQSIPDARYNSYPSQRGGNCQQATPRVVINTRPVIVNPYAYNYCPPPVSYCRPVVINPYPVYPIYRRGYAYHNRRHGFYRRGWR